MLFPSCMITCLSATLLFWWQLSILYIFAAYIYRAQHSCNDMKMTLWDPLKIVVSEKGKTEKRFLDLVSFLLEIEKLYK